MPHLKFDEREIWVPWQWHADQGWIDEHTKVWTSYLAGFATKEGAEEYGRRVGYMPAGAD